MDTPVPEYVEYDIASIMSKLGLIPTETGGGCTAYSSDWNKWPHLRLTVTNENGDHAPRSMHEPVLLGISHVFDDERTGFSVEDVALLRFFDVFDLAAHLHRS